MLILYDLVQELLLDGHLGGRNSSFGDSEARGSILEVSRSCRSMSLTSPSLEDGVNWVLEVEASNSLPLTGLLAPSFLAKELEGEGRETQGSVSLMLRGVILLSTHTPEAPAHSAPILNINPGQRAKSTTLSHADGEEEERISLPFVRTRSPPSSSLSRRHLGKTGSLQFGSIWTFGVGHRL